MAIHRIRKDIQVSRLKYDLIMHDIHKQAILY